MTVKNMIETNISPSNLDDKLNELQFVYKYNPKDFEFVDIIESSRHIVKEFLYKPLKIKMAVKTIRIPTNRYEDSGSDEKLNRLKREIESFRQLSHHPNIVNFYGLCFNDGEAMFCMELMDMSLYDLYLVVHGKKEIFPEAILGYIAVQVLEALGFCKASNFIHRDVNPKNILLNTKGEVKLCDFGEDKILKELLASTYVETIAYWPPERFIYAENNSNKSSTLSLNTNDYNCHYDIRSDIWSLGITLVEVVYGKLPYQAFDENINNYITLQHIIMNINRDDLINRCCQNKCSSDLCLFINVCLSKVEDRPRSYDDLQKLKFYESYKELEGRKYIMNFFKGFEDEENLANLFKQMNQIKISDPRLLSAARENNIDLVRTLLEQYADPNIKDKDVNTALHLTAGNKDDKGLVELLLEYGADIDSQNKYGNTCLMTAARNNNIEIVRCLLQNGADINRKNTKGSNVLHYAALNNIDNKSIIKLLLKNGVDIDSQNEYGNTCLMEAARNNKIEIVRWLLQNGADINRKNSKGSNVLHYAALNNIDNKLIIGLLLEHGADIDSQNINGETSLMTAAKNNNIEIVRCLLQNGADINRKDSKGSNILHYAALNNIDNKSIIELLLKNGVDIDSQNEYGNTSLMIAAKNNNIEIVRCLLQNSADINRKNSKGSNFLHYAALNKIDNKFIIELLLNNGADIDGQNISGETCLMTAAKNNNIEIVRCLLQNGANINKQNRIGETAIQIARSNGKDNKKIEELLLDYEREKSQTFLTKIFKMFN